MSGIVQGIGNLIASIFEIFKGILDTIWTAIASVISLVVGLFQDLLGAAEGLIGFILGNIFVIGVIAAAFFGFAYYRAQQGRPIMESKKIK